MSGDDNTGCLLVSIMYLLITDRRSFWSKYFYLHPQPNPNFRINDWEPNYVQVILFYLLNIFKTLSRNISQISTQSKYKIL